MLTLASASPVRLALLRAAGVPVRAHPVSLDEPALRDAARADGLDVGAAALRLAGAKAALVDAPMVLGADQMLELDGAWLEKPGDRAGARAQLLRLRGRAHTLHAAAVLLREGAVVWRHVGRPRLVMRAFSDAFLEEYLDAEGEALHGCLGAYRLEGRGAQLFEAVEGEHAAVLGLPLLALLGALRAEGVLRG